MYRKNDDAIGVGPLSPIKTRPKAPRRPSEPELYDREEIMVMKSNDHRSLSLEGNFRTLAEVVDAVPSDIPLEEVVVGYNENEYHHTSHIWFNRYKLKENAHELLEEYKAKHAQWVVDMNEFRKKHQTWWEEERTRREEVNDLEMRKELSALEAKAKALREQVQKETRIPRGNKTQ